MRIPIGAIAVLAIFLGSACADPYRLRCSKWWSQFLQQSAEAREAEFSRHELSLQYEIFSCGMHTEPPLLEYKKWLARRGPPAAAFLQTKLTESLDDEAVVNIIEVLSYMQRWNYYDVVADQRLMQVLRQSVSKIRDDSWKKMASRELERIGKLPSRGNTSTQTDSDKMEGIRKDRGDKE
jgi:hypothetical protein